MRIGFDNVNQNQTKITHHLMSWLSLTVKSYTSIEFWLHVLHDFRLDLSYLSNI